MQAYSQDYTKKFFSVKGLPVVFIVRGDAFLQALVPDKDSGAIRRDDERLAEKVFHPYKYKNEITESDFVRYCHDNNVNPTISEKSLHMSFFLADTGPAPKTSIQSTPKQRTPRKDNIFHFPGLATI